MNSTILLCTAALEVGLAVGYSMRWFLDCRLMFLEFCAALGRGR